jgi:hypothetical protein
MLIILATLKTEIRGARVPGRQKVLEAPSQPIKTGHNSSHLSSQLFKKYKYENFSLG